MPLNKEDGQNKYNKDEKEIVRDRQGVENRTQDIEQGMFLTYLQNHESDMYVFIKCLFFGFLTY